MTAQTVRQVALAGLMVMSATGCALLSPTCLARQERGTVAAFSGEVRAGQIMSHQVRYDTQGSQNTGDLTWDGYRSATPPRIKFYATRVSCTSFQAPPLVNSGECAVLASAGWTEIGAATHLIVTHGRGNPEALGATPEYKIWVVGDAERNTHYSISITWFYGPDC